MPKAKSLHELFIHELQDVASAEEQITKALPKMIKAAESEALAQALDDHLQETKAQLERVVELLRAFGESRGRTKCAGMAGILAEGEEMLKEKAGAAVQGAAIIAAAQKVEHYEIATYGTLKAWAERMGHREAIDVIDEILAEEKAADEKLSAIAEAINEEAEEDADDIGAEGKPRRRPSEAA